MNVPCYLFQDFLEACSRYADVILWKSVIEDASMQFGLNSKKDILDFITNGGLENITPINTAPLRAEGPAKGILVDSYEFKTGKKIGYLAILKSVDGNKWVIKSFHLHHKMGFQNLMNEQRVKDALKAAGISKRQLRKRIKDDENQ